MEKKIWVAPRVELVCFEANDYISTCWDSNNNRLFKFFCNAASFMSSLNLDSARIFAEAGDPQDLKHNTSNSFWEGGSSTANQWFGGYTNGSNYNNYYKDNYNVSDQYIADWNPWSSENNHALVNDGDPHYSYDVTMDQLHQGWLVYGNETDQNTSIYIWHGANGNEIHAMLATSPLTASRS